MLIVCAITTRHHMEHLVSFGDSYTDESRSQYFVLHRKPPPAGLILPPSTLTLSGGFVWPRIVAQRTGAISYNYAVGGAMCSDDLVPNRVLEATGLPFPSVSGYELGAFKADSAVFGDRRPNNTVYTLWIGTNDLGTNGFLGNAQRPGATLRSFVDCVWGVFDRLYAAGGRRFVVFNQIPLELAPMYATPGAAGHGNVQFWRGPASHNVSEQREKLLRYTSTVNAMLDKGAPLRLRARWPGATMSVLDAHSIFKKAVAEPHRFLDAPANAVTPYRNCLSTCVDSPAKRSSFLWYDELHPSEKMHEVLSQAFIDLLNGGSKYGKTFQ
ncbi:hypothetical protein CP532_3205 [Ophiocordyceps camponoti-leonardi (nom. inval.)]|nr:hypothetical protein CP532_3205 [Ophiocordyceps camponoti-leonardi (nom. inval.)]